LVIETFENLVITFTARGLLAYMHFVVPSHAVDLGEVEVPSDLIDGALAFVQAEGQLSAFTPSFQLLIDRAKAVPRL
jgi:hypothetical protein